MKIRLLIIAIILSGLVDLNAQVSPDEFYVAGTGIVITFGSIVPDKKAGFLSVDECRFVRMDSYGENEKWIPGGHMNDDQDHQGRHVRIPVNEYSIQHVKLCTY